MRRYLVGLTAAALVAGLIALAVDGTSSAATEVSAGDIQQGAEIYAEACASCHGANLEGQADWRATGADGRLPAPPHDETGHTWHHSDRALLQITQLGTAAVVGRGYQSNMPGFGETYSEDELRNVIEFIKSRWPERARNYQAEVTARDLAN